LKKLNSAPGHHILIVYH